MAAGIATGPVTAAIRGHTVGYSVHLSHLTVLVAGCLLATLGSLLLSGDRGLPALGAVVGAGAAVCFALWRLEFVSTWCAFAAVWSVLLLGWLRRRPDAAQPHSRHRAGRGTSAPPAERAHGRRTSPLLHLLHLPHRVQ
ncbi:DUF6629 family protein [Streptomyces sp. NPDC057456]|uniref:DUF6629 family protein n=1 Tax=Streptomyces sp. NPDC057456 TaxID=3346139 RepID=UPI00368FD1C1